MMLITPVRKEGKKEGDQRGSTRVKHSITHHSIEGGSSEELIRDCTLTKDETSLRVHGHIRSRLVILNRLDVTHDGEVLPNLAWGSEIRGGSVDDKHEDAHGNVDNSHMEPGSKEGTAESTPSSVEHDSGRDEHGSSVNVDPGDGMDNG